MRVYLNSLDAEHKWSVDEGDVSTETHWDVVTIQCTAVTRMDLSKRGSATEPSCWMDCWGTLKDLSGLSGTGARVAVIS